MLVLREAPRDGDHRVGVGAIEVGPGSLRVSRVGLVLGPNINVPMDPQANEAALAAQRKAKSLAKTATAQERALIEALSKRFAPKTNPASRIEPLRGLEAPARLRVVEPEGEQHA
jgi:hypothetical protein